MLYTGFIKPLFDFLISGIVLIVTLPLMFIVGCCLYFQFGQIFFIQRRSGKNKKEFNCIKFITLEPLQPGGNKTDKERENFFTHWLRVTSVDELPQFWNVLRGDMSIIGPRPLLVEYNNFYKEEQNRRFDVKPGITGWAQVNGRNTISWDEKFTLDIFYVTHINWILDLKIFIKTFGVLVNWKQVYPKEGQNIKPF
jgi:lipopolysaccharide/colanic/teichoic acid biosynthesis glycosyltransferase